MHLFTATFDKGEWSEYVIVALATDEKDALEKMEKHILQWRRLDITRECDAQIIYKWRKELKSSISKVEGGVADFYIGE